MADDKQAVGSPDRDRRDLGPDDRRGDRGRDDLGKLTGYTAETK
jgi:hypothetical protein